MPQSIRLALIRSNVATHGLLWAVQFEERRYRRAGCSPTRAASMAIQIVTGRLISH